MREVTLRGTLVLFLTAAGPSIADPATPEWTRAALFGPERDRVVQSAFIPSADRVHGQVRLIRRGAATCVQSLLHSKALRRGLQRIRSKERVAWPEGREGHADSSAFLDELRRAQEVVLPGAAQAPAADEDGDDGGETGEKHELLIEFVLAPGGGFFALYEPEVREAEDELQVVAARPLAVREASRVYVERAMSLMLASAFHLTEPEAAARLASAQDPP